MHTAVIVLSWNAADTVLECLTAISALQQPPDTILVVDNNSLDGTADRVAERFPDIHLVRNERNLGFSGGMNVGLAMLQSMPTIPDIVILLNQDTLVDPGWLDAIVAPFADEHVGAVGCKIRYPDGKLQHAGISIDERAVVTHLGAHELDTGQYDTQREVEYVTGAALAVRMSALDRVGVFDEGYTPAYYEDLDLCWRIRQAGYRIIYAPEATLTHQESLSLRDKIERSAYYNRGRLRFVLKHFSLEVLDTSFLAAERAWVSEQLWVDEARVLRWAYAETLIHLSEIVASRRLLDPQLPDNALIKFQHLFHILHQSRTEALRNNALQRADRVFGV